MSFLTLDGLRAGYGSSQVLHGVDLSLDEGQVMALMGRNGMGKSTTIKAICRLIPSAGGLSLLGQDLHVLPSYKVARLGVGLVPEGRRCFPELTVQENLVAAARDGDWTLDTVYDLFARLGERAGQRAASLSGGEQQMLAIGRALMTNPRLLILDEATEGLAPIVRQEIWTAIRRLKNITGMTILLIDKSLKELSTICDTAVILERGTTVWSGDVDALTSDISERYIRV